MSDNKFDFGKINIPKLAEIKVQPLNQIVQPNLEAIERASRKMLEDKQKEKQEEIIYKQRVLNALESIQKNTANLTEIMSLLHDNSEKQEEIFNIIVELLSISKSNNKDEAESIYRKTVNKIGKLTSDVETIQKLYGFATTAWNIYQGMS